MDDVFEIIVQQDMSAESDLELIGGIADRLLRDGYVEPTFKDAIINREKQYPTGLVTDVYGVAVPHIDTVHVKRNAVFVATLREPVTFHEMGGEKDDTVAVECLFMLLLSGDGEILKLLAGFMKVLQNREDLTLIRAADSPDAIREVVRKYLDKIGV